MLAEESLRVGELADRVGIDDTTATRLVDRLEAAGLVERVTLASDRRVTVVGLTARRRGRSPDRSQRAAAAVLLPRCSPRSSRRSAIELVRLTAKAADALRTRGEELIHR